MGSLGKTLIFFCPPWDCWNFSIFLSFLFILKLSCSKPFDNTSNYASTANIEEVVTFYNLGDKLLKRTLIMKQKSLHCIKKSRKNWQIFFTCTFSESSLHSLTIFMCLLLKRLTQNSLEYIQNKRLFEAAREAAVLFPPNRKSLFHSALTRCELSRFSRFLSPFPVGERLTDFQEIV